MLIGEPVNNSHMHLETISCPNLGIVSIISKHLLVSLVSVYYCIVQGARAERFPHKVGELLGGARPR